MLAGVSNAAHACVLVYCVPLRRGEDLDEEEYNDDYEPIKFQEQDLVFVGNDFQRDSRCIRWVTVIPTSNPHSVVCVKPTSHLNAVTCTVAPTHAPHKDTLESMAPPQQLLPGGHNHSP